MIHLFCRTSDQSNEDLHDGFGLLPMIITNEIFKTSDSTINFFANTDNSFKHETVTIWAWEFTPNEPTNAASNAK